MRLRIIAAVAACLAAVGVSGCGQPTEACAVADYGGGGTAGYQTPQQALQSVLARHVQWLSATGWKMTERSTHAAYGFDQVRIFTSFPSLSAQPILQGTQFVV